MAEWERRSGSGGVETTEENRRRKNGTDERDKRKDWGRGEELQHGLVQNGSGWGKRQRVGRAGESGGEGLKTRSRNKKADKRTLDGRTGRRTDVQTGRREVLIK